MKYLDTHDFDYEEIEHLFEKENIDDLNYTCTIITVPEFKMFINRYGNAMFDDSTFQYLKDVEASIYGIKLSNRILIGTFTCESIHISVKDNSLIQATYCDFLCIHPNYRKKGLMKIIQREVSRHTHKMHEEKAIFQTSEKVKISHSTAFKKQVYNIHLKHSTFMNLGATLLPRYREHVELRTPTVDELRILNEKRYDFQLIYTMEQLEAIRKNYITKIDNDGNIFVFSRFLTKGDMADVYAAVLVNYYVANEESFRNSIRAIGNELKQKTHMISILNKDIKDILTTLCPDKNNELNVYTCNYHKSIRANNVLLNIR